MTTNFFEKGFAIANDAVKADEAKEYKAAFKLYLSALDHIVQGIKCERAVAAHGHVLCACRLDSRVHARAKA